LILRKIIKIVATRCQILKLKCTKSFVGWGSAPDPAGKAYNAPQTLWLDFRGLLLRDGKERKREGEEERGGEGTPCSVVTLPAATFYIKAWTSKLLF